MPYTIWMKKNFKIHKKSLPRIILAGVILVRKMVGNHIIFNENQAFHKLKNVDLSAFPIYIMLALYSHSTVAGGLLVIS